MCRRVSGARRLPTAASGRQQQRGGERKNNKIHTHAYADTESRQKHTQRADAQTHTTGCDWQPAKHRRFVARGQSASQLNLFWRRSTKTSRQNSLSGFPVALHESMPLRWEEKYPEKQGTLWVCSLFWAQEERGPFPTGWPTTSLNTLLLSMSPVKRGCSWSPREPQRFSGVPLGAQREVKVSRRLGGGTETQGQRQSQQR